MQEKLNKIKKYYDVEFTEDWKQGLDWYIYMESTADGYEVSISHDNKSPMSINDNVFYYDSDLSDELGYNFWYLATIISKAIFCLLLCNNSFILRSLCSLNLVSNELGL